MSEFGFIPAGLAEQLRSQHAHQQMHFTEETHRVRDFLNGLDEEQLKVLQIMLHACSEPRNISHFIGRIVSIEEYKFNECPCGENHDKIPEGMDGRSAQMPEPRDPEEVAEERHYAGEEPAMATDDFLETLTPTTDSFEIMMHDDEKAEEYGVELDPRYPAEGWDPEDGPAPQLYRCINCGQGYPNLRDRMLRPPKLDGCSGCQLKSAHG